MGRLNHPGEVIVVRIHALLMGLLALVLALPAAARSEDMTFKVESNLRAAAASVA